MIYPSHTLLSWLLFLAIVVALLAMDLGIFHSKYKKITIRESLKMSLFYFIVAILFGLWVWYDRGGASASDYFTGYLIEKTLSLDNIFVISLIFTFFSIPDKYQHRVLFWGILGVIVLRGMMISLGASIIHHFEWVMYVFSIFLIITGIKMLFIQDKGIKLKDNVVLKFLHANFHISKTLHNHHFLVKLERNNKMKWHMTPLLVALIIIECADLVFAIDSIPAIFAITTDVYIVYTSNIFAILGLRALYFALGSIIQRFHYLKYSLAVVLIFIGSKIFITDIFGLTKFPSWISLSVTVLLLAIGIIKSLYRKNY